MSSSTKEEALIRIRIIANSNSEYDQSVKKRISENIKDEMYSLLKNEKDINNARKIIQSNINIVENIVKKELNNEEYSINYGMNYFPRKKYKGKVYKEGKYESLLISLGEAKGDNWWCILFPPICLVEAEDSEEIEYSFFFKNIVERIFK